MADPRVQPSAGRYLLVDQHGRRLGGPFSTREIAHAALDRELKKRRRARRDCISCGTSFMSEGPHNRMCEICRRRDDTCTAPYRLGEVS